MWLIASTNAPCTRLIDSLGLTIWRPMSIGAPGLVDVDLLVGADGHLDDVGDVAGMGELEGDALAGAFRQLAAVVPVRHVPHRLEDAARARRVEAAAGASPIGLASRSSRYCSGSLPAAMAISSMNPCITNDTPLVPGARSAPVGMSNGVTGRRVHREVRDESARELVGGNHRRRAGDEIAERDQLARRVEPGLEVVVAARPVLVVGHVVFARPQQLHRHARQPGLRPLLGDDARDLADLDVVVAVQTAAESAARPHQVQRDLVRRDARRRAPGSRALGIWLHDQISSLPSAL